jgi:hypothetical protein
MPDQTMMDCSAKPDLQSVFKKPGGETVEL